MNGEVVILAKEVNSLLCAKEKHVDSEEQESRVSEERVLSEGENEQSKAHVHLTVEKVA